jgi:hypothetical protein
MNSEILYVIWIWVLSRVVSCEGGDLRASVVIFGSCLWRIQNRGVLFCVWTYACVGWCIGRSCRSRKGSVASGRFLDCLRVLQFLRKYACCISKKEKSDLKPWKDGVCRLSMEVPAATNAQVFACLQEWKSTSPEESCRIFPDCFVEYLLLLQK